MQTPNRDNRAGGSYGRAKRNCPPQKGVTPAGPTSPSSPVKAGADTFLCPRAKVKSNCPRVEKTILQPHCNQQGQNRPENGAQAVVGGLGACFALCVIYNDCLPFAEGRRGQEDFFMSNIK